MERLIFLLMLALVAGCSVHGEPGSREPSWRDRTEPSQGSLFARRMLLGDIRSELSLLRFEALVSNEEAVRMRGLQEQAEAALDGMALALALDVSETDEAWKESEGKFIEACVRMADYINGLPHQHRTF